MIDLDIKDIRGRARNRGVNHVIGKGIGGRRQQSKNITHHLARLEVRIVSQDVAGDRHMGSGIVKLMSWIVTEAARESGGTQRGKVATLKGCVGNADRGRTPGSEAESLIVKEEERSVVPIVKMRNTHRTACGRSKVVLRIDRPFQPLSIIRPSVGIERAIAKIVINGAVPVVRSGLHC